MVALYKLIDRVMFGRNRFALPLQVIAQHLVFGPRQTTFTLDGRPFHCSTAEKYWFERENYERDMWRHLKSEVRPDDIVYDIGAHIGFWAVRLSALCSKIVALEPSPQNFRRLKDNVSGILNVFAMNVAAAAVEGTLRFSENGTMSTAGTGALTVRAVTLDTVAAEHGEPDVLIMDVEGYAANVLAGASRLNPRVICVEVHNDDEREAAAALGRGNVPRNPYPFHVLLK